VKVRVNDAAGDVLVHLGSSDYLRRYKIYVSHAQAWRQQFQKLSRWICATTTRSL
jgi:hypothetical protein